MWLPLLSYSVRMYSTILSPVVSKIVSERSIIRCKFPFYLPYVTSTIFSAAVGNINQLIS